MDTEINLENYLNLYEEAPQKTYAEIEKKTKHISINVISLYKIDPAINEIYVIPANNLVKKLFITYY